MSSLPSASTSLRPGVVRSRLAAFLCVSLTAVILLIYGCFYGRLIAASDFVPTHDQAAYLAKTYLLADALYEHPARLLNPLIYVGPPAANRPPLMLLVAAGAGPQAAPRTIAQIWLTTRLTILFVALLLIAWQVRSFAWLPAAACTIVAAPGGLTLNFNMLMMDQSFEAMGLLAFIWLAQAVQSPVLAGTGGLDNPLPERSGAHPGGGWRVSALGALGTLLLFLIKPAALAFLFPLYVLLAWRFWRWHRREPEVDWPRVLRAWLWPYLALAAVLVLLAWSPLGWEVVQQYRLGSRGYWDQHQYFWTALGYIALIVPPWLLAGAGLTFASQRQSRVWRWLKETPTGRLVTLAALVVGWWFFFNAVLTYTLDNRIVAAAMPIGVCGALLLICRRRWPCLIASVIAAGFFLISLLAAQGQFETTGSALRARLHRGVNVLSPLPTVQHPIHEVGLLRVTQRIAQTLDEAAVVAPTDGRVRRVMLLTSDDFVELNAFKLAQRFTGTRAQIQPQAHPWGSRDLNLAQVTEYEWYLTKAARNHPTLVGDVWTSLQALDALIHDPQSPWRHLVEPIWTLPIQQPDLYDTVTLWRLQRAPNRAEMAAGLKFIAPYFKGTPGQQQLEEQIKMLNAE